MYRRILRNNRFNYLALEFGTQVNFRDRGTGIDRNIEKKKKEIKDRIIETILSNTILTLKCFLFFKTIISHTSSQLLVGFIIVGHTNQ